MKNIISTYNDVTNNMPVNKLRKNKDARHFLLYIVAIAFSVFTLIDLLG